MPRGISKPIVLLEKGKGGIGAITNKRRTKSSFSASFEPHQDWAVSMDSRDLNAIVGTALFRHMKRRISQGRNPETGRIHKRHASDTARAKSRGHVERHVGGAMDNATMASHLKRTMTASTRRWGPGGKRISPQRTRLKFYFADKSAAGLNKFDSKQRKDPIIWLGVGGAAGKRIAPALRFWMREALAGSEFTRDTRQKADAGIGPNVSG